MTSWVDRLWYGKGRPLWLLYPLSWLYRAISERRRRAAWAAKDDPIPVPVVVVGNITAGGTGKSPLTAALVRILRDHGWNPVVLTRGYGGKSDHYPLQANSDSDPAQVGDEPVMLANDARCPVVVDPDRRRGALWVLEKKLGNILVCDDGLQHYRLPRDIELAVFDAQRGLGNGALIPVGPLRELPERLTSVDYVITNGGWLDTIEHESQFTMTLEPTQLIHLKTGETRPLTDLVDCPVMAVAGIGNPERFFDTLRAQGAQVTGRALPDHHVFTAKELQCDSHQMLVMTAKDAVKCRKLAPENAWVLEVEARLPEAFAQEFISAIDQAKRSMASHQTTSE